MRIGPFRVQHAEVRSLHDMHREGGGSSEEHDRPTPVCAMAVPAGRVLSTSPAEEPGAGSERRPRRRIVEIEEFELAKRLVDRMLALGRTAAAEQILAEPIMDILEAAREGALPNADLVDAVGRCGVKLANATLDARWADAVIELHLLAGRPLRFEALRELAVLRSRTRLGDDVLITRYYEALLSQSPEMSGDELHLVQLVADLVRG